MRTFLAVMEYPCTRDDLVRAAFIDGWLAEAAALRELRNRAYQGARDVMTELNRTRTYRAASMAAAYPETPTP